jgi:TolB-like protein/DNA-binding SARP family transcriptional activator/Flp pilus assembly protein TadD
MASLELVLFGGFRACAGGRPVDVPGRKERALLAILALSLGELRSRDKLAGLLWSDRADKQARDSLKSAIARLKQALGPLQPPPIVSDRDCLCLDREGVAVDVAAFERLIGEGTPESIAQATTLYRGDLLDGLDVRDPAFEEWLLLERQRLRVLARDALGVLLDRHLATGAHDSAAAVAHRLLALDPLREAAHRALMQVYAEQGQTALALKQYQFCRDTLQRELGVKPEPETDKLYRSIQEKRAAIRPTVGEPKVTLSETKVGPGASPRPELEAAASVKPAIAVLPFRNLSDDAVQRYFSDGITEDIITELSRVRSLTVIARHSSFAFRDHPLDVVAVAQKLGVECIVEGSVRRAGNRARITARLIDTESGGQLWSEHYDRDLTDIFAVQDEIVQAIVATLPGRIDAAGMSLARRKRPENLTAYDCFWRGLELYQTMDRAAEPSARHWFEKAIAADPNLAVAYSYISALHLRNWYLELSAQDLEQALDLARRAADLDPNDGEIQGGLGVMRLYRKEFAEAAFRLNRAIVLNPNDTLVMVWMAWLATYRGRPAEGLDWMSKAQRLNPYPPSWFDTSQAMVLYGLHRYEEAAAILPRESTDAWVLAYLLAAYGHVGRLEEARTLEAKFRSQRPDRSLLQVAAIEPYESAADLDHLLDGLCRAGVSE